MNAFAVAANHRPLIRRELPHASQDRRDFAARAEVGALPGRQRLQIGDLGFERRGCAVPNLLESSSADDFTASLVPDHFADIQKPLGRDEGLPRGTTLLQPTIWIDCA